MWKRLPAALVVKVATVVPAVMAIADPAEKATVLLAEKATVALAAKVATAVAAMTTAEKDKNDYPHIGDCLKKLPDGKK